MRTPSYPSEPHWSSTSKSTLALSAAETVAFTMTCIGSCSTSGSESIQPKNGSSMTEYRIELS